MIPYIASSKRQWRWQGGERSGLLKTPDVRQSYHGNDFVRVKALYRNIL